MRSNRAEELLMRNLMKKVLLRSCIYVLFTYALLRLLSFSTPSCYKSIAIFSCEICTHIISYNIFKCRWFKCLDMRLEINKKTFCIFHRSYTLWILSFKQIGETTPLSYLRPSLGQAKNYSVTYNVCGLLNDSSVLWESILPRFTRKYCIFSRCENCFFLEKVKWFSSREKRQH